MTLREVMHTELRQPASPADPTLTAAAESAEQPPLGRPVSRLDGPLKVQGLARFAGEVHLPGQLYAAIVHSSIARGRIKQLDTAAAEQAEGVVAVMSHRNAPRLNTPKSFGQDDGVAGAALPVMQDDAIHWNGEAVAVVLADSQEQANHAAALVRVTYQEASAVTDFEQAKAHAHRPDTVMGEPALLCQGDAEAALASAEVVVDQVYRTPRHNHNAIELHAVTAQWQDDTLLLHDATQMIHGTVGTLAEVFGLKPAQVRVLSPFVGGGFGGKGLWSHQILAAAAAKLTGRPVRLTLSREGVYRLIGGRTLTEQRVALGAHADGRLAALIHTGVVAMTAHNNVPEQFTFPARHLYATATLRLEQQVAEMDMVANTFMRAPGESVGTFALECALDELAERLQLDPVELRRRLEPTRDPASQRPFSSRHLLKAYADGAQAFGWQQRAATPGTRREGEWLIGMGVATATYPYYRMPGTAARVRLEAKGHATASVAGHEMGMGTATVQTQHLAVQLGLPLDRVAFVYGDSSLPAGAMAGGSSQTAGTLAAVKAAVDRLLTELLDALPADSPLHGCRLDQVEVRDGGLARRDGAGKALPYGELLKQLGRPYLEAQAEAPAPEELKQYSMHSYGAQFCEVAVSAITGEVRVRRFLGSFDAGRILNPKTAASQFRGGIIMGLGLALTEQTLFDPRSGRIVNAGLSDYHVPVHLDVPPIEVIWTNLADPHAPMGARGIGEIGITGTAAAVVNAIYNATGKRIRRLPVTPDKLL